MKSKDLGTEEDLPPVNRNTNSSQPSTTKLHFQVLKDQSNMHSGREKMEEQIKSNQIET